MEQVIDDQSRGVSVEQYLRRADKSPIKLEYCDGNVVAMAGASTAHVRIARNLGAEIHQRLKGKPCEVFGSDLRISVPNLPSFSYPDLSIVCGELQLDPRDEGVRSVTNPRIIFEILSASTEAFDRGRKFHRYMALQSLQEYVLVSQDEPRVDCYLRRSDGTWLLSYTKGLDSMLTLSSIEVDMSLNDVYRNVSFQPLPASRNE